MVLCFGKEFQQLVRGKMDTYGRKGILKKFHRPVTSKVFVKRASMLVYMQHYISGIFSRAFVFPICI